MMQQAAFVFGKFQQLHNGHIELFRQALENHERLYIGVSAATKNSDVEKRVSDINKVVAHNGWRGRVCVLTESNMFSAYEAVHEPCDVVLGEDREVPGRRLAAERGADYIKVKRLTSSTEVRRRLSAGEDVNDLVPSYLKHTV
jgi:cytidyltransferase-like protein